MNLIQRLEQEEMKRLGKTIPDFSPGDTLVVRVGVVEGDKKREQAFEGIVIAKRNRGLRSSFIVRKISSGEGVERTFQTYSPLISSIEVKRRRKSRPAILTCEALRQIRAHPRAPGRAGRNRRAKSRAAASPPGPGGRRGIYRACDEKTAIARRRDHRRERAAASSS